MTTLVLTLAVVCIGQGPAEAAPTTNVVGAHGTELVVNGEPWRFAGYNLPCANAVDLAKNGNIDYYLNDIQRNSHANVIRVWFFQSEGGPGNWTAFDTVISALQARGMRAIVTLADSTGTCDEPNPPTLYKTISWYQSGYLSPYGGYGLSFHDYAVATAKHFAGNPAVAFWQLVNEPQAASYDGSGDLVCPDDIAARNALRTFADAMTAAIHAYDPDHLVDLGSQSLGQCGVENSSDYTYVHAGSVQLCEYHDYGEPAVAMPSDLQAVVQACNSLGKPVFVGESGIPANVGSNGSPPSDCAPWPTCSPDPITFETLDNRAHFFQAKMEAATQAGIAGYVIWEKSPYYTASTDAYSIPDGDPTEAVMSGASASPPSVPASSPPSSSSAPTSDPPSSAPESPWVPAFVVLAVGLVSLGVALGVRRQRRRKAHPIGPEI